MIKKEFLLKSGIVAVIAFAAAAAVSAYLKPGVLVELVNLILCN